MKDATEGGKRVDDDEAGGGEEDVDAGEAAWEEVEVMEEGERCGEGAEAVEVELVVGDAWRMVYGRNLGYFDCLVAGEGSTKSWQEGCSTLEG